MPTILVVDDSATDRRMATRLLEKNPAYNVFTAVDGEDALREMEQRPADLVVTDLQMPNMDGLELVEEIGIKHREIPVILITSHGSEEIALQALQRGAASYVPKGAMAAQLLVTIDNVFAANHQARRLATTMDRMVRTECHFVLENDSRLIPPLIGYLQENMQHVGLCDQRDQTRIGVALDEALLNALHHGNLELSSDLRDTDSEAYRELVEERLAMSPYRERRIHVEARITREQAEFVIRDEGPGFQPGEVPDPTEPANLERPSGRGLLLMRTFMDEIRFNEPGNEVTLIKLVTPKVCAETADVG